MRDEEIARITAIQRGGWLRRLFTSRETEKQFDWIVDHYQISVEQCFISPDFNEELPLYILDIGEFLIILFGQWMYDPHVASIPEEVFEEWVPERQLFRDLEIRCFNPLAMVLECRVQSSHFVAAQRLPAELRFKRLRECELVQGTGATLIRDLENAGLIYPAVP